MTTLEQIQAKLKKLQAQADVMIARKAQAAVDQIRDLMLKHGLTTEDIETKAKAKRAARGLNARAGNGKAKTAGAAKYRDDKTGATWTGHGRAPGWIAGVKDRTPFLIEGASEVKPVAKSAVTRAKGSKGQPKGAQPPKYLNPKTGATWSGRGPAPAWLATVKDRSKFLIEGAAAPSGAGHQATQGASKAAKKAAKAKSSATSGVVSKKAAAKKAVAKKAVAKKAVAKKAVASKKTVAKKAPAAARKVTARKAAGRKTTATKAARKTLARKAPAQTVATTTAAAPQTATAQTSA
ncbi:Histone family protein nucleoid-structuring protein H-NS [Paraburkholderia ribeironis]|uniref:Histone family protein nucleoid-structuring protein H-NS n=1 Tax=Paraburkholderia ribeironis TaxID=1247936 RepID=A0A1N7SP51_9BURK|nr:H-NS family nucleoid-associated regulatory protein [Paraburkholderia ribeironis]SIT49194.1 Histone family protein nucleoid-structuring protein H-NS [Paraburkholderia ribeironis]